MRVRLRWLALGLTALLGCSGPSTPDEPAPLGWPRLLVRDLDRSGGALEWTIDERGRYERTLARRPSYDEPPTGLRCRGTIPAAEVAPLFLDVASWECTDNGRIFEFKRPGA